MNENLCRLVAEHLNTEESKKERATLAQRVIAVLGVLCFIVLVGVATNAYGQESVMVAKVGDNTLTLYRTPCQLGGWFAKWKRAVWFYEGKSIEACWIGQRDQHGTPFAHTVDEAGEPGAIPFSMFRRAEGV